jgi:hypothetical protein
MTELGWCVGHAIRDERGDPSYGSDADHGGQHRRDDPPRRGYPKPAGQRHDPLAPQWNLDEPIRHFG